MMPATTEQAEREMMQGFAMSCRDWYASGNQMRNYQGRAKVRTWLTLLQGNLNLHNYGYYEAQLNEIENAARERFLSLKVYVR